MVPGHGESGMSASESSTRVSPDVAPLTRDDIGRLNLAGHPRIDATDIRAILAAAPTGSFWIPETGEFILVAPWRNRAALPHVHTLWAFDHDALLIAAAVEATDRAGAAALVMLETGERRRPRFYQQHGFSRVEIIRTYEHIEPEVLARQLDEDAQRFARVTLARPELLALVERLDHAAFPWFWWNSTDEFLAYLQYPGVEVWAGLRDQRVVSYFGFTMFHHWGHLDRIAVMPGLQGQGLGRSALAFAAGRMVRAGARRIGLSTQNSNRVSRRLYESVGYRHTRQSDYDVYGIVLDPDRVYAPAGAAPGADESEA